MTKPTSISLFLPAFNDEKSIGKLVEDGFRTLRSLTDDFEIIVINDGSSDSTGAVLDRIAERSKQMRVIHHRTNLGYGAALRTGFKSATKELIFYTDGDGQYDIQELKLLWPLLSEDVQVVNGYKIKRKDDRHRAISGALYNKLARLFFRIPIRDVDCDFRLLRRRSVQQVSLSSSSGAICVELVHKLATAGCVFREAPVHHYPRTHGKSQFFTPRRIALTFAQFFGLWWSEIALKHIPLVKTSSSSRPIETDAHDHELL